MPAERKEAVRAWVTVQSAKEINMLRPYQATAVESALQALTTSGSAVLQMPTGAGKTKAATEIIKRHNKPVWFICHRQEIERQAAEAFTAAGIDFGIVSPRAELDYDKPVQIVSVASLRLHNLPPPSLVIWDECHHVPAPSWARLHKALSAARHLGLTATPERLDGKGLSDWFKELVVGPSIEALVSQGFLSPFRYFAPSDPDLTAAKLQAGDYKKCDADKAMNTPVLIGDAVAEYNRVANGKKAIAFCTSREASKALADRFNAVGIPARHVDGETDDRDRRAAIDSIKSGSIKILCNVEVFTEGFDVPGIEAAILMRPTKSPTLLLQMIGRALRFVEDKTAIIMDHAGLHRDHGWFADEWQWSIEGGAAKARRQANVRGPRRCPECKEVRAEREPVCTCGYEFSTGREIGEYDGVLTEVRGVVPEGCVTVSDFARFAGTNWTTVMKLISEGMPADGKLVIERRAVAWLIQRGSPKLRPFDVGNPEEYEDCNSFSRRVGVSSTSVYRWVTMGIPHASNGWIHVRDGLEWVERGRKEGAIRWGAPVSDDLISPTALLKEVGLSTGALKSVLALGLPVRHGRISKGAGVAWIMKNYKSARAKPVGAPDGEYEPLAAFRERIHSSTKRFCKPGLPRAPNGWVHIQRGLEWVRDNTNIEIPPEAWPAANDNGEQRRAA